MKIRWSPAFSLALVLMLVISLLPAQALPVYAVSPDVVISQVYGGGGNSGATWKNDFIELFNRGGATVNLAGWSVQYGSSAGTTWSVTSLTGSIQPGQYYLVQEAAGSGGTTSLPTPDATGSIAMSASAGKVALANSTTALSGACPTGMVDLVGFGTTNCSEGTATPALSNTTAALRNGGGCTDTDNNGADFTTGAPNPRNTASAFNVCGGPTPPSGTGAANPSAVFPGDTTLLTVAVTPGGNPPSTGLGVSCDLSSIGGSVTQAFFDNGSNGDSAAGDNTFSYSATVANSTTAGAKSLPCNITDAQSRTGSATINLTVTQIIPIGTVNGAVSDTEDATQHRSPFAPPSGNGAGTTTVTVQGVIYEKTLQASNSGAGFNNGFFLQNTAATADADPHTSDGVFVFMGAFNDLIDGYVPQVGDEVVISAKVTEFFNLTELSSAKMLRIVRTGVNINTELAPIEANPPVSLADANRYWERMQGMRVEVPADSIVLGGRNVFSPPDAEIWLARADSTIGQRSSDYERRAFRDAHPLDDNYDPANWDGNGYRMLIGSFGLKYAAADKNALIDPARTFDTLSEPVSGGLNYNFNKYRVEVTDQPTFAHGVDPAQNHAPQEPDRATEYSIVDYNVENLYDYRNNPDSGCDFTGDTGCPQVAPFLGPVNPPYDYVPASDADYQARLDDIAHQIVNDLHSPDILMMQEVENQDFCSLSGGTLTCGGSGDGRPDDLQDLALKIKDLSGVVYDSAFDRNSSDLRGIVPSFMYRTDRVELLPATGDPVLDGSPAIDGYTAVPYDGDTSNPKSLNAVYTGTGACESSYVFPRALDAGLFRIYTGAVGDSTYRDVYVLDNHFKSGPDTCVNHRKEQANYNAAVVAFLQSVKPDANIVVGGDLNVYAHPDNNSLTAVDQLAALYDPSLGLKNLYDVEIVQAPQAAYSYVFQGMAQTIDQIFVNQPLLAHLSDVRTAHLNSDFPADNPGDGPRGTSDHDPTAARFLFSLAPVVGSVTVSPEPSTEGSNATASASFSDPDASGDGPFSGPFTCTVDYGDGSGALAGTVNGSTCTGPAHAYSTYGTYTVTVSVTDSFGSVGSQTGSHAVIFNFAGFFQPVDNLPVLNIAKAGSSLPVKFGLGGDKGLNIIAAGYPKSQPIACDSSEPTDTIESTATAGASGLSYDPLTQTYTYIWKTEKSWANSCRQLTIKLVDGTIHQANFRFTR